MPKPLKKGLNIHVEFIRRPAEYAMRSTDVYTDFYGLGYITSGDREIITPEGIYFIHAGDVGLTDIGYYHRTIPTSSKPYERYGVKFTPKIIRHFVQTVGEDKFKELMSHKGYHLSPQAQKKVRRILEDMLYEYEHYDGTSELILEGMLNHLLITVFKERILHTSIEQKIIVKDDAIMDVLSYLDLHYAENPTIEELSGIACLSRAQFMKRFKQAVGSSYKTYLNCYKTHQAQSLLTETDYSIGRIADELGFCNANYFCNVFKAISGQNPLEFRREGRRK